MAETRESRPAGNRAASMSLDGNKLIVRRAAVLVDEDTITIKGPAIFETLRPARMRPIFVGTVGGWMLDRRHLANVLAVLDAAGYRVAVVEAGDSQ